jgi:hypothetical protein
LHFAYAGGQQPQNHDVPLLERCYAASGARGTGCIVSPIPEAGTNCIWLRLVVVGGGGGGVVGEHLTLPRHPFRSEI